MADRHDDIAEMIARELGPPSVRPRREPSADDLIAELTKLMGEPVDDPFRFGAVNRTRPPNSRLEFFWRKLNTFTLR